MLTMTDIHILEQSTLFNTSPNKSLGITPLIDFIVVISSQGIEDALSWWTTLPSLQTIRPSNQQTNTTVKQPSSKISKPNKNQRNKHQRKKHTIITPTNKKEINQEPKKYDIVRHINRIRVCMKSRAPWFPDPPRIGRPSDCAAELQLLSLDDVLAAEHGGVREKWWKKPMSSSWYFDLDDCCIFIP